MTLGDQDQWVNGPWANSILGERVRGRKFSRRTNCQSGKGSGPSFEQSWMLCAKFGWYWHSGLKCDKFTDRQTDEQTEGVTKTRNGKRNGKRNGMENGMKRKTKWKLRRKTKYMNFVDTTAYKGKRFEMKQILDF